MYFTTTFHKVYDSYMADPRFIDCCGGARSSKTFSILQFLYLLSLGDKKPTITSVVSETMPHLKRGAIRDFKGILSGETQLWSEDNWSKSESIYTLPNGSIIEFFSCDQAGKVHGPARDRLFINEAQNVPYEVARQLFIRTRGLIIFDYNPTHSFWAHEKIAPRENCISIHSTYKDNTFLTPEQVAEIESNRNDRNWWRVYGEGLVGQLDGLIYDFEQIDSMPQEDNLIEIIGLDFGFSSDPTAIVRVKADTKRKVLYVEELCCNVGMLNSDIIERLERCDVPKRSVPIYADCAEPKSIAEIAKAGFNVKPSDKGAPVRSEKLKFQIQWMQGWKLCVTKGSLNLIKELRNYTWDKDKDGNTLNFPIDKFNHLCDAMRYACFSHLAKNTGSGQYNLTVARKYKR